MLDVKMKEILWKVSTSHFGNKLRKVHWSVMALGTTYDPKIQFREVITAPLDLSDHPGGTLIPRKKITISNRKLPSNNLN